VKKLKVMTIVGTRPEIIRLSRVINKLDDYCEHILVHTGQNYDYELNQVFFDDLSIRKPNYFLNASNAVSSASETIGNIFIHVNKLFCEVKPDALLVLGDTNSCLSVIPAKKLKIPIFHMEAGNRCFDERVPEEINRKIVDHVSDINLTYSSIAREYLIQEGISPNMVIKIGSPMREVINHYESDIYKSDILARLGISSSNFILVSAHREENIEPEESFTKLVNILNRLALDKEIPIIVSTHPRTQKRIDRANIKFHKNIVFLKPLGFFDYNKLQISARVVLSDSGTITEESSILQFNALNIRESHERPEGMEEASTMMVGLNYERIEQALSILKASTMNSGDVKENSVANVNDYMPVNVSEKVLKIIHSYTDYVNRYVWKKY